MDIEEMVQETFSRYRMSAVLILRGTQRDDGSYYALRGSSSGFIIGKGESFYLAVTCKHCVVFGGHNVKLSARLSGKTTEYDVEILHASNLADVAIIKVKGVPKSEDCPVLEFGDSEDIAPIANIVQLGYVISSRKRLHLNPAVSPGIFVALSDNGRQAPKRVIYAAAGKTGCSGSAVLLNFKVIGVLYGISGTEHLSYAVSSTTVQEVLKAWLKLPPEDVSTIEQMIDAILTKF